MKIGKRGQEILGMSFGTIFSIIIIIFIVFVAFFAIRHFLKINDCAQVGLFYDDFTEAVEKSWTSGKVSETFSGSLPVSGIFSSKKATHVCFGDLSQAGTGSDSVIADKIIEYFHRSDVQSNVFIYPPEEVCIPNKEIKCRQGKSDCIETAPPFFCVEIVSDKVEVKLTKQIDESAVTISQAN